jgi:hypothetical protein
MWRAVADQPGVAVVRPVDIEPSVGQGFEIAMGEGPGGGGLRGRSEAAAAALQLAQAEVGGFGLAADRFRAGGR